MKLERVHIMAAYGVAAFFIFSPLSETLVAILPATPGETAWRFGSLTLFSRALLTPLLGVLIAVATAHLAGHRRLLLTVAVLCALFVPALLIASGLFTLDALEMRRQVLPEHRRPYDLANAQALAKLLFAALVAGLLGGAAARSAKLLSPRRRSDAAADVPLIRSGEARRQTSV